MEKSELVNKELQKFIQGTRVIEGYDAVDNPNLLFHHWR